MMVILIALAILGTPYLVTKLLPAQHYRTKHTDQPQEADAELSGVIGIATYDRPTWSAPDDRQLTGRLTDAAPRSTTDQVAISAPGECVWRRPAG